MFKFFASFLMAVPILCGAQTVSSQQATPPWLEERVNAAYDKLGRDAAKTPAREVDTDLAVPEAPAFTVLGVTPETVARPTNVKEFATNILNGVDPNGNLQTGLAIQTSPYLLFDGRNRTIEKYQGDRLRRIAARTGVSLATTKGVADDDAVRFAAALTVTPWDRGDPRADNTKNSEHNWYDERYDLTGCLADRLADVSESNTAIQNRFAPNLIAGTEPPPGEVEKFIEDNVPTNIRANVQRCRDDFREATWNASAWNIGVAPTWVSPSGDVGGLEWSGVALYSTLAYGFEEFEMFRDDAQILLHARYRMDEQFADSDTPNVFFEQDTLTIGGQLRFASPSIGGLDLTVGPDLNFLAEAAYIREERDGRPDEELFRYSVGAEVKLAEDIYLKGTIGTEDGRDASDDQAFVLFNLKWNLSADPTLQ